MHVLMLLMYPFDPDPRVSNEAQSLLRAGHKVTLMAWDREPKKYAGFKNWEQRINYKVDKEWWHPLIEDIDGIHVVRVRNTRFMQFLPYNIIRLRFWWKEGYEQALKFYAENSFDAVHCHDFDTLPIGIKLKKKLGLPVVYDAHEIWGYMVARDLPKWWANYYLWKEKRIIKYADKIIIAEDKYDDYFNSITNKKLTSLLNCKHLISREYIAPNNKKFSLLYIGTLNYARYIFELVDVVKELNDVECIIGGSGNPEYIEPLKQKCGNCDNVKFIGKVPREKVIPMTQKFDVIVCMINPSVYNNKIATANKQFEAMVCGRPIICTKGTRSGEITEKESCGLVIDYNKNALRDAITQLRDSPELCEKLGRNALKAAIDKYNWEIEEKKLLGLYENLEVNK